MPAFITGARGHDFGRHTPLDLLSAIGQAGFACTQLAYTKAVEGVKSYDDVSALLGAMGVLRMARFVEVARAKKSVKNDVNRRVNAEMANQARSTGAAAEQLELIERAERTVGLAALPPALREFCRARRANPELSLAALGEMLDPPASKSAMYHRVLRLQQLVAEAGEPGGVEGNRTSAVENRAPTA